MPFLTAAWITAFVSVFVFVAMGAQEAKEGDRPNHGWLWGLLSFLLSAALITGLDASAGLIIVAQVLLFVGIGAWRMFREG